MIALYLAGCTLIFPAEITQKVGFATEPGDSGEVDTGDTGDTGVVDTGETGAETGSETGETGDSGGETGVDTGDTDTASDTASDTSVDTSDTAAPDADGDGYTTATDCDDSDGSISPGADEVCDGADNNCDGTTDESTAADAAIWCADVDRDGYGDPAVSTLACDAPATYVADATDCDDTDAASFPGAGEVCDGVDNNCDGTTDESTATDAAIWYADTDGDGYGDPAVSTLACAAPAAYVADATDCDDADASVPDVLAGCDASYTAGSGATMIYLTGGTYSMGSGLGDSGGSYTDHDVTLSHAFYLAQTETSRGEWESDPANTSWSYSSVPSYPCTGTTADCPADTMTWYDAAMYANWLSVEDGLTECYLADGTDMAAAYLADPYSCPGYRLPTEAEWEYAARAGVDTTYSGSNTAAAVAWTYETAYTMGTYAHASCSLAANAWGFCDMSGNVYEWTNDWYDPAHGGYGDGSADVDPAGPLTGSGEGYEGSARVFRGGFWYNYASFASVAYRNYSAPSNAYDGIGFRLARSIP